MAITHEIIQSYENYGRCVKISNGIIEAYVTIDVGPRIIRFAHCNGDNIFYNDIERKSNRSGEKYDEYYYESADASNAVQFQFAVEEELVRLPDQIHQSGFSGSVAADQGAVDIVL